MSSGWKYIMVKDEHGYQLPIIFPDRLVHDDVWKLIQRSRKPRIVQPVSAGFLDGLSVVSVSGKSTTMKLDSDPEDARTINIHPYQKGLPDLGMGALTEKLLLTKTIELLLARLEGE